MKPIYQIQEYGSFITGKDIDGYVTLPERTFEQLENFILSNRSKDTDALELMGLSARKGRKSYYCEELCWRHYHERRDNHRDFT